MKTEHTGIFLVGLVALFGASAVMAGPAEPERDWTKYPLNEGPFSPAETSLNRWECPDWFKDAKLGIWMHWGPQAVPMQGDWYAYGMYIQGHRNYKHHVKTYGHPSEFGYKDIIELFNPTEMDFKERVEMYRNAGAKYVVMMGCHHDNYDMWDSKYHEWNAVKKGAKRDLVGEFVAAAKKGGMRYGISHHNDRGIGWMQGAHKSDETGPMKDVPYDGADPEYESLYCPAFTNDNPVWSRTPYHPPEWWELNWYQRTKDMIDKYRPDLCYFDGSLPFKHDDYAVGRRFLTNYYNDNVQKNGGKLDAVMCLKDSNRTDHAVPDYERRGLAYINPVAWQTDTCIGNWYYNRNWIRRYKSVEQVVTMLIDIVSKNGNLLLSVPVHPSGEPQPEELTFLSGLGHWMAVNGEAIYGTRPWLVYGEGDLENTHYGQGHMNEKKVKYRDGDFRFTSQGGTDLFAFFMAWPQDGELVIKSLANHSTDSAAIKRVTLVGSDKPLAFQWKRNGLKVKLPEEKPCVHAWALHVEGEGLRSFKVPAPKQEAFKTRKLPAIIPAAEYDFGGEGVAFHDTTAGNSGGAVREDDVDIRAHGDRSVVQDIVDGEWLEYTADIERGIYDIEITAASMKKGGTAEVFIDEARIGSVKIPMIGKTQVATISGVELAEALSGVIRVKFRGDVVRFESIGFKKIGKPAGDVAYLGDLSWAAFEGPKEPRKNTDRDGGPLVINGLVYDRGIGCDSQVSMAYELNGQYQRFRSDVGVDDDVDGLASHASLKFQVYLDGKKAYDSGLMKWNTPRKKIDLDVSGVKELKLFVHDGDGSRNADHANWANARLIKQ